MPTDQDQPMSTPTPPTPTACEGYQAVATDGGYLHVARVHCNGCAETASLRERLSTAEAERDELRGRLKATEEKRDWWHRLRRRNARPSPRRPAPNLTAT